jgi:hypothetical protein
MRILLTRFEALLRGVIVHTVVDFGDGQGCCYRASLIVATVLQFELICSGNGKMVPNS